MAKSMAAVAVEMTDRATLDSASKAALSELGQTWRARAMARNIASTLATCDRVISMTSIARV